MDKKLFSLVLLFFVSFVVFSSLIIFNKPLTQFTRAREDTTASGIESLVVLGKSKGGAIVEPLAADGADEAEITVFVRNSSKPNLDNKAVTVSTTLGEVRESTQNTVAGKATFHLRSTVPGQAVLTISVSDGSQSVDLTQKPTINFQ